MHPNHIRLVAIDPVDAQILLEQDRAILIDVREADEWRTERIPGAILNPLSRFDPSGIPLQADFRIILYCHGGARSPKAADFLYHAGHLDLMHLRGGLTGWKQAGLETVSGPEIREIGSDPVLRFSPADDPSWQRLRRA